MKLTGTNSDVLKTIRQPTKLEESSSLVFIYPMIIDKYLERKWGLLLRDFFTTQFMSQIKISNVLNITSQASRHSVTSGDAERIENAAERTAQSSLGLLTANHQPSTDLSQQYYGQMAKHEYQDKINQFRYFIRDQIMIDPRFADTRPIISNITIENLIDVPLIIGTKMSGVQSIPLFWILFFATGQYREDFDKEEITDPDDPTKIKTFTRSLRMDRPQSFEYIARMIKDVAGPKYQNYEQFLTKIAQIPANTGPGNRISAAVHAAPTEIDRAIKVFTNATNERYYSEEIGFSRNAAVSINNAYLDSTDLAASTRIRAQNLFTSFLSNYVIPITQSAVHTVVGIDEVNINAKLSMLGSNLLSTFMGTYSILDSQIKASLMSQISDNNSEASLNQLSSIERMCEANSRLSVISQLEALRNISFGLTSTRADIINFIEQLSRSAAQFQVYQQGLISNLLSMSMGVDDAKKELDSLARDGNKSIQEQFYKFFTEASRDYNDDNAQKTAIMQRQRNADGTDGPLIQQNTRLGMFLTNIPGGNIRNQNVNIETYIQQICTSLGSICSFMAYYTFFSYLCEYMGEIKAKVEIQKKDALDFPNYCLVFRKEVIESLYGALAAANYKKSKEQEDYQKKQDHEANTPIIMKRAMNFVDQKVLRNSKKEEPKKPTNDFTSFKIHETEIMNMIRVLNNRLNIPNMIVVDDKTDTIYYKWMYSGGNIMKLTYSTVQNYVKHQQEILPGY